jgi:hypothetical protein
MLAKVEWSQGITDSWSKVASFAPKLLGALVVWIVGTIVAKIIRKALTRLLATAKVDQHLSRTSLSKTLASSGGPSNVIVRVAYIGLMLLVAQLAIGAFGKSPVADALNSMMAYIPKIIVALLILFVTNFVVDKVVPMIREVTARQPYNAFVTKAAAAGIWLIGGFAALDQIQIARSVVDTLFRTIVASLGAILVIKFGVGGIWAARDRFWPRVYDAIGVAPSSSSHAPVNGDNL